MRRAIHIVLVFLLGALASCGGDQPGPAQTDDGSIRIVTLSPAASKVLIDLGLGESIVGRHNYDQAASSDVSPVGDQSAIDYELLLSLRPTHVVLQSDSRDVPERLRELSASAGFEIVNITRTLTLDDVELAAHELEARFAPGAQLAAELHDAIAPRREDRSAWGTVLVAMQTAPTVDVLGPGSAHQELFERLGYTPAVTRGLPYMPMDAEDVLALDPGVIVLVMPRAPGAAPAPLDWEPTERELGSLAGLGLRAVGSGRVVLIDEPLALVPSTSFIGVSAELERRLAALGPLGSQHDDADDPTHDESEAGPG